MRPKKYVLRVHPWMTKYATAACTNMPATPNEYCTLPKNRSSTAATAAELMNPLTSRPRVCAAGEAKKVAVTRSTAAMCSARGACGPLLRTPSHPSRVRMTSPIVRGRSAGFLAIMRAMTADTSGGTRGLICSGGTAGS